MGSEMCIRDRVNRITVNFDFTDQLTDRLFNSAQIQYTGTPTVNLSVDGDSKISQTLTSPAGVIGEAKIYFPAMSTGIVPFVRENNGEEFGRVINFSYDSQAI